MGKIHWDLCRFRLSAIWKYRPGWKAICTYLDQSDFSVFKDFHVIRRKINFGAKNNSLDLTKLIYERFDRVISMEDDLEVSPNFLVYMNKCLEHYEKDEDVMAVCGYSYPIEWRVSKGANCIGRCCRSIVLHRCSTSNVLRWFKLLHYFNSWESIT